MMTADTIDRYQSPNDIYLQLADKYGVANANVIADIALGGDATAVNDAIVKASYGTPLETSTARIFGTQLITDPLAAPAAAINSQLGKAFKNFFKSPWIVLTAVLVGAGVFFYFAGNPFKKK